MGPRRVSDPRQGLVFAAIVLQLVAFPSDVLPWSTPSARREGLWLGSYALLVRCCSRTRASAACRCRGGLASNLVAIVANGGLMPVRGAAMSAAGTDYDVHNNSISLANPHLGALVDRWAAPSWVRSRTSTRSATS